MPLTTLIISIITNLLAANQPSPLIAIPLDLTIEVRGSECEPAIDIETVESDLAFANARFLQAGVVFYIRNVTNTEWSPATDAFMTTSIINKFVKNTLPDRVQLIYGYSMGVDQLMGITLAGQKSPGTPLYSTVKVTNFYRDQTVLCHELGHVFMLGHMFDNKEGLKDIQPFPDYLFDPIGFLNYCWLNRNVMNYGSYLDMEFSPDQLDYIKKESMRFAKPILPKFP